MPKDLTPAQLRFLEALFPGDSLLVSPEELKVFAADAGRKSALPQAVVRPGQAGQMAELLRFADKEKIPVVVRGRATNLVGACVPDLGGIVAATSRLNAIREVSPEDFLAVCEPGVLCGDLKTALAPKGLFYPPDPASAAYSSIGGNVSTNAGGLTAVKYGVTRNYVLGLSCILPGGARLVTGSRSHKNVAGLDLTGLLTGSEGTLAFFESITLKLLPKPQASATILACFDTLEAAVAAAYALLGHGLLPMAMEIMAQGVLAALARIGPVPWTGEPGAAMLFAFDGLAEAVAAEANAAQKILSALKVRDLVLATAPDQEKALWDLRRTLNQASFTVAPDKIADDVSLPRGQVVRAMNTFTAIASELGLAPILFGHLGDGNIHVNYMYDARDPKQAQNAATARERTLSATLDMDGSISGEHGLGLSKRSWLEKQYPPEQVALMRAIKGCFDPNNILNPGKAY